MELASPKKMVGNAVVLAGIPVIIIFVSPITVEMVIEQAVDNPLITAVVVLIATLLVVFGRSTSRMGGGAPLPLDGVLFGDPFDGRFTLILREQHRVKRSMTPKTDTADRKINNPLD